MSADAFDQPKARYPLRRLGEVAPLQTGYAFKSEWYVEDGIRLLRNANVHQGFLAWDDVVAVDPLLLARFAAFCLKQGDIVLTLDRPIVASGLKVARLDAADMPILLNQRVGRFKPNSEELDADYLYAFLRSPSFVRAISGHDQSLGVPHISPTQVERVEIPVPPLHQQRRIADTLACQLSVTDEAVRAAEQRLTIAKGLIPAYLWSAFQSLEHTENVVPLGDVCDVQLGKMLSPKSKTGRRPVPYLRNENVQWNRFDLDDVSWMDFSESEEEKFRLLPGDLLVCEGGEPGRSSVWNGEIERCCYQKALHRIRPRDDRLHPPFLMYCLWKSAFESEFVDSHSKTTIAHLPLERLVRMRIALPRKEVQRQIANTLAAQLAGADAIEQALEKQLALVATMPAAVLREVFEEGA